MLNIGALKKFWSLFAWFAFNNLFLFLALLIVLFLIDFFLILIFLNSLIVLFLQKVQEWFI